MSTAKTTTTAANQNLLPLYTEWTNRQLSRVSHRPIGDLSTELRDYRVVAAVAQAVLGDPQRIAVFRQALSTVNSNIDGLTVCLRHLQQEGVNCNRITATEIDAGQLGSVLQLLYSLHNYKQTQRRETRPPPSPAMPPSAATSKLPSIPRSTRLQPPTSRIASPATKTALPVPASTGRTSVSPASRSQKTTTTSTALRPPSTIRQPSGNNNGSVSGSSTFSSSSSVAAAAAKKKPSGLHPPSRVATVATTAATTATPKAQQQQPAQSKMLKLKLFNNKEATKTTKEAQKKEIKKPETTLRAPSSTRISRLATPSKTAVQLRTPQMPSIVTPSPEKRCSKSSEEDSAYAGFGSTSPSSSTQSSISLRSASSKGSAELVCETEPIDTQKEKPTMAVRALGVSPSSPRPSVPASSPSTESVSPSTSQPTRPEKSSEAPAVGVVSPIVQRKVAEDSQPSSSKPEEKVKPAVPVRKDSRLESEDAVPPSMAPSLPTYAQLLREGRIQTSRAEGRFDSSTSEDSLDSVTTTIRLKPSSGCCSEGNTIDRNYRARSTEPSGYTSEGGFAIYQKMQERMKECRESVRRAQFDYGDSFEDSSSLSSGISDNFEDVSTDDLSGPDHPMAKVAAAYASSCDYQPFTRSTSAKGPRSSSTSIDSRARRIAEQENLHALLQQCRTSQRGAGTLRTPFSPQLVLSAEAEALRSRSRSSTDQTVPAALSAGYHSLDRKTQLAEFYGAGWQDRAAMALVSPRRVPQPRPSMNSYSSPVSSLNAGGMSRSMVLLESPSPRSTRRRDSPRSRGRFPLSVAKGSKEAGYASYGEIQLHRLADEVRKDPMGSQLSLASSSAYATLNEKYEAEIRKMSKELDGYRQTVHKLTRRHDDYAQLMEMFNQRLSSLSRHVEKAQLKPDEVGRLRVEIDNLRAMSGRVAQSNESRKAVEGAGELLRQPSLESVASMASHRSSMSSSSKSSKTDKTSLNSFGGKSKKSWASNVDVQIRSSFTKAFSKKKNKEDGSPMHLHTINGSNSRLDEVEVDELKKQLEDRDVALTDVRLDALDRAREVDLLRETVNRLKNENKQLKHDMTRLLARSRASSQASLAMHDEEPVYEVPPTVPSTPSSKRSSGCNSVKVTVNVDLRGVISSVICPDNEIIIGFLPIPSNLSTWAEIDQQIFALFDTYIGRVDGERLLGLNCMESVTGYQIGNVVREKGMTSPAVNPSEVIGPTTTVRLFLKGASQKSVDSLVLETLFPMSMLEQLLRFLLVHRRLFLSGATGIGKSNLARQLAVYLSVRIGQQQDSVHDIKIPDENDEGGSILKVEKQLEALLKGSEKAVVLLDNVPRNRIAFISSVFSSVQIANEAGPFVICTVNRACQLPDLQIQHNFKMFLLTNRMDGVKGFMGRFLRRRIIEAEFRLSRQTPPDLLRVIAFLPEVLQAVNNFIEKANSIDVTVGPRIFLQCPLDVEESREWFVRLWNDNIVPYMVRVAREGVKCLGRCGSFEDPTEVVCDKWPWTTGPSGEELLHRLSIKDISQTVKQPFNPLDTLIRLQANRVTAVDHV